MAIPVEDTAELREALEELFETVERDGDRIVCRSGSGTLEIEGHRVRGGMPLHSTELTDVDAVEVDAEAGEVRVQNGSTSYTFRVPGA
jgi:hypothetical protein